MSLRRVGDMDLGSALEVGALAAARVFCQFLNMDVRVCGSVSMVCGAKVDDGGRLGTSGKRGEKMGLVVDVDAAGRRSERVLSKCLISLERAERKVM